MTRKFLSTTHRTAFAQTIAVDSQARGASIPAPTNGWDAISPVAKMPPTRAFFMNNWFPQQSWVEPRPGYFEHASTSTGFTVDTLMSYAGVTGSQLFAASRDAIFNITAGSNSIPDVSGFTNVRFQWTNFSTTGGHFMVAVNGADAEVFYNGIVWAPLGLLGLPSRAIGICAHQNRLWFIPDNSTAPAHLPVDQITGTVTQFELGALMTQGGYVLAMGTWTIDAGDGPDDNAVFVTSEGQVIVYKGINPDNAPTDWSLLGVYNIGTPIGRRCLVKNGADLLIICDDGVLPLSKAMIFQRSVQIESAITYRIQREMNEAARLYKANFGWELCIYPRGTMTILNIPIQSGGNVMQFVQNDLSGAWTKFTAINASCWVIHDSRPFYGGPTGKVFEFDRGGTDGGKPLTCAMMTSFNQFGLPGINKKFGMLQPMFTVDRQETIAIGLNVDFKTDAPLYSSDIVNSFVTMWGTALWGMSSWEETSITNVIDWRGLSGEGQWASIALQVQIEHPDAALAALWGSGLWGTSTWGLAETPRQILRLNGFNITFEQGAFV